MSEFDAYLEELRAGLHVGRQRAEEAARRCARTWRRGRRSMRGRG